MKHFALLLLLSGSLLACTKYNAPSCINQHIRDFEKNQACDTKAHVKKYLFQEQEVYVFFPGYCIADATSNVYDENCNVIGTLGGLTGNTMVNGQDFSNAKYLEKIWEN